MGKVIAISIPKGGVGKTTAAVNLSASLAVLEKKILLIDMDPSGSCAVSLGFTPSQIKGDTSNILGFIKSIDSVIHKTSLKFLDFIPTTVLSYEAEEKLERLTHNVYLFRNILQTILHKYDFIIIDCPPYLKGMTSLALTAADSVLIPIRGGHLSILALKKMLDHIVWIRGKLNNKLDIEGILLSMYEANTKVWTITEKRLYKNLGKFVLMTSIPKNTAIAESTYYGKPALIFDAKSKGAISFLELAKEIIIRNKSCPILALA